MNAHIKNGLLTAVTVLMLLPTVACTALSSGQATTGAILSADRRTVDMVLIDQQIQNEARLALQRLPQSDNVNVHAYNGTALLYGQVTQAADIAQAKDIVSGLKRIKRVHSELVVAPSRGFFGGIGDASLATAVRTSLVATIGVPSGSIDVVTEGGVAYLMGMVTKVEGERAAAVTAAVPGVNQVILVFEYISPETQKSLDEQVALRQQTGGN